MKMKTVSHGESSLNYCEIYVERKKNDRMFNIESCVHLFCSDCISKHVTMKIQDSFVTINCPGLNCKSILGINTCRSTLPKRVIELWEKALCEEMFDTSQKLYCPYKDCLAMVVNEIEVGEVIIDSECPFYHRMFCVQYLMYSRWIGSLIMKLLILLGGGFHFGACEQSRIVGLLR